MQRRALGLFLPGGLVFQLVCQSPQSGPRWSPAFKIEPVLFPLSVLPWKSLLWSPYPQSQKNLFLLWVPLTLIHLHPAQDIMVLQQNSVSFFHLLNRTLFILQSLYCCQCFTRIHLNVMWFNEKARSVPGSSVSWSCELRNVLCLNVK